MALSRIHSAMRGFTMVELLVVIGIIAIIAALLMPVIGIVRGASLSVKCQANLRQLSIANFAYAEDWRGILVPIYTTDANGDIPNASRWDYNTDYLNRLRESGSTGTTGWKLAKTLLCPVSKAINATNGMNANYAMNDAVAGGGSVGRPNRRYSLTIGQVMPHVFMITDALDYKINPSISTYDPYSWQIAWDGTFHGNTLAPRHRSRANTVMYDGAVTAYEASAFVKTAAIWK